MPQRFSRSTSLVTFGGPLDEIRCHPIYGSTVHPGGTDNVVEEGIVEAIDFRRRRADLRRRCTANYDRRVDPFATTWDLEPVDDD